VSSYSGINLDIQNKFGETPLHLCSGQTGNLEFARILVLKGANFLIKNALGDSPLGIIFPLNLLDYAKRYGNHDIAMMFNSANSMNQAQSSMNGNSFVFMDAASPYHGSGSALGSMRKTKYLS